eukprot:scaffold388_cov244-Pinguiococcus_pyrenoidosus.AAC.5
MRARWRTSRSACGARSLGQTLQTFFWRWVKRESRDEWCFLRAMQRSRKAWAGGSPCQAAGNPRPRVCTRQANCEREGNQRNGPRFGHRERHPPLRGGQRR